MLTHVIEFETLAFMQGPVDVNQVTSEAGLFELT